MKKAGMMLVAGLLVTGALAQDVTSVNVVGFNKIAIGPQKLVLVTLPFESFGDSNLQDLVGDQLPRGSVAYIWDRTLKTYIIGSRTIAGWSLPDTIIHRGDGFWLKNTGTTTNYVSFMGEVPAAYNNSSTTTVSIAGIDAVGYAYPTDVVWTNTTLAQAAPRGSVLYMWDESAQTYNIFSRSIAGWSTPEGHTIPAGRAFWIKTSVPIDWTEIAPYTL